jgi:transaldolase
MEQDNMARNVFAEIMATNPDCEVWWDSSPLVYNNWVKKMLASAPGDKKETWTTQLAKLFDPENPEATMVRGVTTNPPLSFNAIKDNPAYWAKFIKELINANPDKNVEEIFWLTYKEIVKRGAELLRPLWEASEHKYGYISGQIDPRFAFDYETMAKQAREIAQLGPNVMVKCPGTKEGYQILEDLTALGIATNNTSSFCVPQYMTCMRAVSNGLQRAKDNGVDLFRWRSVITHMSDRFSGLGDLKNQAESRGIELSEEDIRWGELAIFKRAYHFLAEQKHPSKMLMCSMRLSPKPDDGTTASWHIEKVAGGDLVYTCPPSYIQQVMMAQDNFRAIDPEAIYESAPAATMDKLMQIPYYMQSYEPDGMKPDQFNRFAPLVATLAEFSGATRGMVDFVAQQFQQLGKYDMRDKKAPVRLLWAASF